MTDAMPVVRWDLERGQLVNERGDAVTSAQQYKARKILELGLLRPVRTLERSRERVVRLWRCAPLPRCVQGHTLTHTLTTVNGQPVHAVDCDCQAARGTMRTRPRRCSHAVALLMRVRAPNGGEA